MDYRIKKSYTVFANKHTITKKINTAKFVDRVGNLTKTRNIRNITSDKLSR